MPSNFKDKRLKMESVPRKNGRNGTGKSIERIKRRRQKNKDGLDYSDIGKRNNDSRYKRRPPVGFAPDKPKDGQV